MSYSIDRASCQIHSSHKKTTVISAPVRADYPVSQGQWFQFFCLSPQEVTCTRASHQPNMQQKLPSTPESPASSSQGLMAGLYHNTNFSESFFLFFPFCFLVQDHTLQARNLECPSFLSLSSIEIHFMPVSICFPFCCCLSTSVFQIAPQRLENEIIDR